VKRFFGYVTLLCLLAGLAGVAALAAYFYQVSKDLPSPEELVNFNPGGITEIYATDRNKNGKPLRLAQVFSQNREFVSILKIPKVLQDATVAIEDERFYSHPGVDIKALGRIVYVNSRDRRLGQGGSTLTQQLARNVFLSQRRTMERKAQEMLACRSDRAQLFQAADLGNVSERGVLRGVRLRGAGRLQGLLRKIRPQTFAVRGRVTCRFAAAPRRTRSDQEP
jgi:penicillin-binding protein 1A